jgi:hypothetical protein
LTDRARTVVASPGHERHVDTGVDRRSDPDADTTTERRAYGGFIAKIK